MPIPRFVRWVRWKENVWINRWIQVRWMRLCDEIKLLRSSCVQRSGRFILKHVSFVSPVLGYWTGLSLLTFVGGLWKMRDVKTEIAEINIRMCSYVVELLLSSSAPQRATSGSPFSCKHGHFLWLKALYTSFRYPVLPTTIKTPCEVGAILYYLANFYTTKFTAYSEIMTILLQHPGTTTFFLKTQSISYTLILVWMYFQTRVFAKQIILS